MAYTLHPQGVGLVKQEYDVQRGYGSLYEHALATSPHQNLPPSPLADRGFAILPCLAPGDVAWVLEQAFAPDGGNRLPQLAEADLRTLLTLLIRPRLDAAVKAHFQSNYTIVFAGPTNTVPDTTQDPFLAVSYRWHCDGGPSQHLKFIVYLDGPEAHDGATEVIDGPVSDRLRAIGYGPMPLVDRLSDLSEVAADHGLAPLPIRRLVPEAGSGLLFEPNRIVHRGLAPTRGRRRVFTLGFVPFPAPWETTVGQFLPIIRANSGFDFPAMRRS